MTSEITPIRDAATVIVLRDRDDDPKVLMGQRGSKAAFMPNKFVFPGGAVDAADHQIALADEISTNLSVKLSEDLREATLSTIPTALIAAAIRELWEETGLIFGTNSAWTAPPPEDWQLYAETGHRPCASALEFVFRAITPPGRPRRFDARFFLLDAQKIRSDLDDFSRASDELSHLQWVRLSEARAFDLPFITEIVLAELQGQLSEPAQDRTVPFFKNTDEAAWFKHLHGRAPSRGEFGG